ncbi:MAG: hypothetical protein ACRDFC_00380 [Ignavibacteria bacterium]
MIICTSLVFFLSPDFSNAQIIKSKRKFRPALITFEFLATYNQPLPNLYGDVAEFFTFRNYGVQFGYGAQLNIKLSANKKGTNRPYLSLGYANFIGRDNNRAYIDSNIIAYGYPLPGSQQYSSTDGKSKIFLHNFNAGVGFEYAFMNKTRWTAFLGAEVDLNVIFGTYRQDPGTVRGNNPAGEVSFTIKQAARFGFAVGGGVQLRIHKNVGFIFSTKYKLTNVLGKDSKRTEASFDLNKMNLLDKSASDLNTMLNKDRNINYFEFGLGIAFFAGRR